MTVKNNANTDGKKIKPPSFLLISRKDRDFFAEHLSMMIGAGMNISEALGAIKEEATSRAYKKAVVFLQERIDEGYGLWRALEETKLFKSSAISLLRVGEESGRLRENLQMIADQQKKDMEFTSKMRSAAMYPLFVLSLSVIVGVGIAWFILPRLALVFASLKLELPLITRLLIGAGKFLGEYGKIVVPSFLAGLAILIYLVFFFRYTKVIGQWLLLHTPVVKKVIEEIQLARLGYILGSLLDAGLPVLDALEALSRTTPFYNYRKFYSYLKSRVAEGNSFHECFLNYRGLRRMIPISVQQIIVSGEKTGCLAKSFLNIGGIYEVKIDNDVKNLTVMLEPLLLVIVWLGVVAVALAVILPIYNLIGGLSNQIK